MIKYIFFIVLSAMLAISCSRKAEIQKLTDFVDPFIGTGYHGHTFPGAAWPFGQVQLSPDNGTEGWDWCSGYHYSDSILAGFSHLHLSGTGIGDLADISFLPVTVPVVFNSGESNADFVKRYCGKYRHEDETATPGYYSVTLKNNGVKAELSVTERIGLHRYIFPKDGEKNIIINLGFAINWDKPYKTDIRLVDDYLITGSRLSNGWAEDQHVYFAVRFSEPLTNMSVGNAGGADRSVAVASFSAATVMVKVGISSVSVENALANLDSSMQNWDFEATRLAASDAWEKELSKIKITSSDNDQKKIFYTSLYHTMIAPALFSDMNGEFKGLGGDVQKAEGYKRYTVFSLWDTYRALHPLYTIVDRTRVNDMVKSMLDHYKQCGILPVWELEGNETFCMVGNHSISVIAEAIMKDIGDFDRNLAFEAMKATSLHDRDGMGLYDKLGFMPADKVSQSVAKSLEVAVDDWAVAAVAQKLGKTADAEYFFKRSESYREYFDKETGFMRGKLTSGKWTEPFDPVFSQHGGSDYTEGNAWQYIWIVPHNVDGLMSLFGGKEPFAKKLEQLFKVEQGVSGEHASPDISGLIGAYAHGNEPGHHTVFLFNFCGMPWRTQELNRQIQTTMYTSAPDGLCGNEDCGQMSAWYVFSALGFYPVNPSDMKYQIGSPIVQEARIEVSPGKYFTVLAPAASVVNKYIQEVKLNGETLKKSYIMHNDIMKGGTLEFTMGAEPNRSLFQ
ncbi:MAG: GH92 family glycosyl hydrolase [Bacteroidales bacterium]|jgi:predicted alpha-1,2-mannosidase|nr:GH92 family glycosyl hydrolase [Bacteroidales bacterium]